jgi:hypothetical protein
VAALSLARSPALSLAAQWGRHVGAGFFTRAPLLSLCLVGPILQLLSRCPERPFPLSLHRGPALSDPPPPRPRRGPASAHSRMSPDFLATTPAHAPSSLLRALPVPRARPPPHFALLRPLSRSAHIANSLRRPAHVFDHPARRRPRQTSPSSAPR